MIKYRKEIDGLRAIAVLPVVFFHADFNLFSGGYVGVDIFFVISGFLISNILLVDISNNEFSLFTFYERRIRRILPALLFVLLVTTIFTLIILLPPELDKFGKSLFATTFFYSNYFFMFDIGYFNTSSEINPLLHTWSLSVEEQFYIIFPLFLYVISHLTRKKQGVIIITLTVISFYYSVYLVSHLPNDAFYSTPARIWELMLGAILAMFPVNKSINYAKANALSVIGLLMILYSILFFTIDTPFPGGYVLIPVLGTCLIIYSGVHENNLVGQFLSLSPFRFFGLISFSLYLWHWPLFVFYKMWKIDEITMFEYFVLILLAIFLSYLTWLYIETPFRKQKFFQRRKNLYIFGITGILISGFTGAVLALNDGFSGRFDDKTNNVLFYKQDRFRILDCSLYLSDINLSLKFCQIGDKKSDTTTFALWGDSHAEAIFPAINDSAYFSNKKGVFVGRGGCLPLLGVHNVRQGYEECKDMSDSFLEFLIKNPEIKTVVLVARWSFYALGTRYNSEGGQTVLLKDDFTANSSYAENKLVFSRSLRRTIKELTALDKKVVLVNQVPATEFDIPTTLARASIFNRDIDLRPRLSEYVSRHAFVNGEVNKIISDFPITLISPHEVICGNEFCEVLFNGSPIYRDSDHISMSYAKKLSFIFDPIFHAASNID